MMLQRWRFLMLGFSAIVSMVLLLFLLGIRINVTPSMPLGFYRRVSARTIHRGDLVAFCLPKRIAGWGKEKGYIGYGVCSGDSTPLLKQVIALPGDRVLLLSNSIQVNQIVYFAPQKIFDHQHQLLRYWIRKGIHTVNHGIWVYGFFDPVHSWDSRYFGPVPLKNILGIYRPLWIFC